MERSGMLLNASRYYWEAVAIQPDHARSVKLLGSCLLGLGELKAARAALRRASLLQPFFPDAHCDLGTVLQELGEHEAAEKSLREADRQSRACGAGPHLEALFNLGNFQRKRLVTAMLQRERTFQMQMRQTRHDNSTIDCLAHKAAVSWRSSCRDL
eukprot:1194674-Prorocentrum_minimum.AAC.13